MNNSPCSECGLPWFGEPKCESLEHANTFLQARVTALEAAAEFILCESVLPTIHGPRHERAGKRVRTYQPMLLSGEHKGIPVYEPIHGWHVEDPEGAVRVARKAIKDRKKKKGG